jgi:hypothetical protein
MWKKIGLVLGFLVFVSSVKAQDPITEIIRMGVIKVIKAVDLKIQRMQNETLWLQNAQKVLENTLTKARLEEISGWVQSQRDLYKQYYEELWKVKSAIAFYSRIQALVKKQALVVRLYREAWAGVSKDNHFTAEELMYIGDTYIGILKQSLNNLEQVQLVIQSFALEMSDGQRLEMIEEVASDIDQNYSDLKAFNVRNVQISLGRAKDEHEVEVVRMIYGIK